MKCRSATLAVLASTLLSCGQTNVPATRDELTPAGSDQTLQALEREWANAVLRRDVETIDHIQTEEFEFIDPAGQVWTKSRALEFIKSGRLQIDSFEMTEFKVRIYGTTAVVIYRVVWNGRSGDNDISGAQRVTDVFVLRGGGWRCVTSHATRIQSSKTSGEAG